MYDEDIDMDVPRVRCLFLGKREPGEEGELVADTAHCCGIRIRTPRFWAPESIVLNLLNLGLLSTIQRDGVLRSLHLTHKEIVIFSRLSKLVMYSFCWVE